MVLREYDAGHMAEVERLCLQILALDVRHADALYVLGMAGIKTDRFELAERMIRRAIAVNTARPTIIFTWATRSARWDRPMRCWPAMSAPSSSSPISSMPVTTWATRCLARRNR